MKKRLLSTAKNSFYGVWYPCDNHDSSCAIILTLSDTSDNCLVRAAVKWIQRRGLHVLAISPEMKDAGRHNEPLEHIGRAIDFLTMQGCKKIGIFGASATGTVALLAASYYPQISLTIALTPADFVLEGYYRDGADGARERPANHESSVSWEGKPLPYLPYAYRHPEYWQKIKEESKASSNLIASRKMFDESERLYPLSEAEKIKVERIQGKVVCIGAEDDVLWDTCKYIQRMQQRINELPHTCDFECFTYKHGTHFVFPESMIRLLFPIGSDLIVRLIFKAARKYPKACRETRLDIDRKLTHVLNDWSR